MRLVQADRDRLVLPRERRVRHDDRHVREIHGHVVDRHRVAVLQPDAAAAGHAGADAAVAGVEQHRQPRLGEHLVERIRERGRSGRTAAAADAASGRARGPPTTSRRASRTASAPRCGSRLANGDRDVGVRGREVGDRVVRDLRAAGEPLVDREHDARHLARAVVVGERRAQSRAAPLSPKYFARRRVGAPCRRPACSRWTCTSMAVSARRIDRWCWSRVSRPVVISITRAERPVARRARRRARRAFASTAFWLSEPLSVISRASIDGGSSSSSARADERRAAGAAPRRAPSSAPRTAPSTRGCVEHVRRPARPPASTGQARGTQRGSGRRARATTSRSWPGDHDVLRRARRSAARSRARSGPTRTHVPVESLKSSASRPSNDEALRRDRRDRRAPIASPSA